MKVLYLLHTTDNHGATLSFLNLLRWLTENTEIIPYILIPSQNINHLFVEELENLHVHFGFAPCVETYKKKIIRAGFPKGLRSGIKWNISLRTRKNKYLRSIRNTANSFNPDLIHSNVGTIHEGFILAKERGIPHVWHLREYQDLDFSYIIQPSKSAFERMLRKSTVITISKDILRHFNLSDYHDAYSIYNGICYRGDARFILPKENYFLCASRISREKGFDDVISTFIKFSKIHPDFKLKIAGTGSPEYINYLKGLIERENCSSSFEFLGFRKDVLDLMTKAKGLIVGSINEGFGRMTAEACFAGCLVIGRNTGGTKEILETTGGYLFDTNEDLLENLEKVANMNQSNYETQIEKIQSRAVDYFSIEQNGEKIYDIYKKLLNK